MFSFFRGIHSDIISKTSVADNQVLFSTDTQQLQFDIGNTRKAVKDPTAAKTLEFEEGNLVLNDSDGNELSSVAMSTMGVGTLDGAIYEGITPSVGGE